MMTSARPGRDQIVAFHGSPWSHRRAGHLRRFFEKLLCFVALFIRGRAPIYFPMSFKDPF